MKRPKIRLALFAVLLAAIAGLWFHYYKPAPERVVIKLMNAVQDGKFHKAERYVSGDLGIDTSNRRAKKLHKAVYGTMRYAVVETKAGANEAQIRVTVTMVDMETLFTEVSQEILEKSLDGKRMSERRYYKLLVQRIQSGQVDTTTKTVTAYLECPEKKWRVNMEKTTKLFAY